MSKRPERFEKTFYEEPKPGTRKFKVECLDSVSERYCHFPNTESEYEIDDEDNPEVTGKLPSRQAMSLQHINNLIKKEGLNEKDVYLTASFSDDYLCVEVVHIKKLDKQEQQEDYKDQYAEWEKQQAARKEEEEQRLKWELESVQKRLADLQKK